MTKPSHPSIYNKQPHDITQLITVIVILSYNNKPTCSLIPRDSIININIIETLCCYIWWTNF